MNQDRTSTTTNYQLKDGYKKTEVGIIPEDWSANNLGKFMMLQRGYDLPHRERKIGDIPIITSSGFGGTHSESRALAPGVVTGRYGTIGDVFYVEEDFWPLNTTLYVKNFYGNNPLFSSYLLKTIDFHSHSGKSGVPGVNRNDLHEIVVCIPPLPEQEAIACTLSDIDALIESLDRLLTKKRQIKQGAMQELLRSKDGWVEKKLSEIAEIRSGGTPSTSRYEFWDGDILWCTPTDITALKGYKYLVNTSRLITSQGLNSSSAEMIPANSVVMTSRATIGECAINKVPVSTNQGFKNFIPFDEINVEFLYYLLQTQKQRFISLCGGSTFLEIGKNQLSEFLIELPPLLEQIEIATILSDMDAEIDSISAKLAKTRQLKQGMMHELLTGRIRLVDPYQGKS
jgi:type I restriction enzyme, S subunit